MVDSADDLRGALRAPHLPVVEFDEQVMIDLSDIGIEPVFAQLPADPVAVRELIATAVLDRYR